MRQKPKPITSQVMPPPMLRRVLVRAYYTDGCHLYEVLQIGVGTAGPVVLRDCVTGETYGIRIDEFRARYWLVRAAATD